MTLTISERSLLAVVLFVVLVVLYAPRKRKLTPLPPAQPIPGTDYSQWQPPKSRLEPDEFIDVEAEEIAYP